MSNLFQKGNGCDCFIDPKKFKPNKNQPYFYDQTNGFPLNGIIKEGGAVNANCSSGFTDYIPGHQCRSFRCENGNFTDGKRKIDLNEVSCEKKIETKKQSTRIHCADNAMLHGSGIHTPDGFNVVLSACHDPQTKITHWVDYELQAAGHNCQTSNDTKPYPRNYIEGMILHSIFCE